VIAVEIPELPSRIRTATPADVPVIRRLIAELAAYEREPDSARATEEQLRTALFGEQPAVHALIAEDASGTAAGFAVWFRSFSTWEGVHGIYLEDLFVLPEQRGSGLGRDLLIALARIAVHHGYARFEWWVLNWNTPSIDFYRALGAVAQDEWTTFRVTGDALTALARRS